MMIRSYCTGCRLRPLLLRLPQLRRTIQYHYFHFDRSPLQESVRAEGGPAENAGEVTLSLLCSRSSGIFIEVCERSACTFSSLVLVGFSNADFGGCRLDRKSTSGICQFLGTSLVSWSSRKQ